ncbi:MAG: DUF1794 domain-containing protein [Zetaproteobacteria bacterium]|nr:MAG: DUF1794 domain-containing protein [Zetaproteobacteria bacterium]
MTTDYGPLELLIGRWEGDAGLDVAPEPAGEVHNPYRETIEFCAIGDVTNAGHQTLAAVQYRQRVSRLSDGKVFHDESGYWMWDAERQRIMQSLVIPRGVCLLAGGHVENTEDGVRLQVAAGNGEWGIVQSPFMHEHARTCRFEHWIEVGGDRLSYAETTIIEVYGRRFVHTDRNELSRDRH